MIFVTGKYKKSFMATNIINYFKDKKVIFDNNLNLCNINEIYDFFMKKGVPDTVIHAAAVTSGIEDIKNRPWVHINQNALMNSNLLEVCSRSGVKNFIFLSCCVMYNRVNQNENYERLNIDPMSISVDYIGVGSTKLFTESLLYFYSQKFNMKCTSIRHTNTFGPWDHFNAPNAHAFPSLFYKVLKAKKDEPIKIMGNKKTQKNLIYVEDVCRFIDFILNKQKTEFEIYNLAGFDISFESLVEKMLTIVGKDNKVIDEGGRINFYPIPNTSKIKRLKFENIFDMNNAIYETFKWIKNNESI